MIKKQNNKFGKFGKNKMTKGSFDKKNKSIIKRGKDNKSESQSKRKFDKYEAKKPVRNFVKPISKPNFIEDENILIGRNAIIEAIKAGRSINRLLIADGSREGSMQKIIGMAKDKGIIMENVTRDKLDKITNQQRHQGILAYAAPVNYATLEDILEVAEKRNELPFILLLDEIEDPHNLGAILRTASAVGVHGVLIPKRRSVPLNTTVAKTSAGAIEYVKVVQINNVAQTLAELRELNFMIVGSDTLSGEVYYNADLNDAIVLVIGSEGKGLRRLTKDNCDKIVKIPMTGKINSLNASVASAILMYEVFRQRKM